MNERLKDIIQRKVDRLESIPNEFLTAMEKIQRTKFNAIVRLLDNLDYKNGFLEVSQDNILKIEFLVDEIKGILTGDEFEEAVGSLMNEMDSQKVLNFEYFSEIDPAFQVPSIANAIVRERQAATIASLLDSTNFYLSNPTREALSSSIQAGASRQELIDTLRLLVQGDDTIDGRLLRSTRLVVSDAFALSDATVSNLIAENLGLEWYLYAGGLIKPTGKTKSGNPIGGSREFCAKRNGKFFHRSEVESWAKEDWNGKMPDTTEKTIFLTRGGYNCQHSLLPVSESVVPKETVKRVFRDA